MKRAICFFLAFCLLALCGCNWIVVTEPTLTATTAPTEETTVPATTEAIIIETTEATEPTVPEVTEAPTIPTGWQEDDGAVYYLYEDGTRATGSVDIDGTIYHFSSTGEKILLVNRDNPVPEGYVPHLVALDASVSDPGCYVDQSCYEDLVAMLTDCNAETGANMLVTSAYRFPEQQQKIFDKKLNGYIKDGYSYEEAYRKTVAAVAIVGTSEHQLGLAVDINDEDPWATKPEHKDMIKAETYDAQQWIMENCWKYGFILRYPERDQKITGFIYEPWHYRYVGRALAEELYTLDLTLEEYLDMLTNE